MTKVYDTGDMAVHALRGVSLQVRRGGFITIIGPSGSCKSMFHDMGVAARSKRVVTYSDGRIVSDKPVADAVPESVRSGVYEAARGTVPQGVPV